MDKNQKGILSKAEMDLIKSTFKGKGEELLYEIRNVLLQFPTKEMPKLNSEVLKILRKYLLPEIGPDTPLTIQSDLYFSLDNLKQIPPEVAYTHIKAMDIMVGYLELRFMELEGKAVDLGVNLKGLKSADNKQEDERFVDLIAYQTIVAYVDTSLNRLKTLANAKEETEEEAKERLEKDSTK